MELEPGECDLGIGSFWTNEQQESCPTGTIEHHTSAGGACCQIPWWKVAVSLTYERKRKTRPNMPPKRWRQTRSQDVNGITFCEEHRV